MLKILRIKVAVGLESVSMSQKLKHGGVVGRDTDQLFLGDRNKEGWYSQMM